MDACQPLGVTSRFGPDRILRPGRDDEHFLVGFGPSPYLDVRVLLQDHVVADDRWQPQYRLGRDLSDTCSFEEEQGYDRAFQGDSCLFS